MDLDVSCEDTPIGDWLPKDFKEKDVSLIAGVEFDIAPNLDYNFERQFATWAVLAKPHSPHLLMVVEDILASLAETTKKHNVTISEMTLEMINDVVYYTGPRRFSQSVAKSLTSTLGKDIKAVDYTKLLAPKLLGDVLVLPGYSFASGVNAYPEGQGGKQLVKHHYAGSWKNKQGGEG